MLCSLMLVVYITFLTLYRLNMDLISFNMVDYFGSYQSYFRFYAKNIMGKV